MHTTTWAIHLEVLSVMHKLRVAQNEFSLYGQKKPPNNCHFPLTKREEKKMVGAHMALPGEYHPREKKVQGELHNTLLETLWRKFLRSL
jgi:hypothetical protein